MFPDHLFVILMLCALMAGGSGGMLIWLGGPAVGPRWAELGMGVGFLAGFIALAEGLPLIDDVANPALGEAALGLIGAAAFIALVRLRGRLTAWVAAAAAAAAGAWVFAGPDFIIVQNAELIELSAIVIAAFCLVFRLQAMAATISPILILAITALGLTGIALVSHAATLAALDLVFVAAILSASVWMWPLRQWSFGAAGLTLCAGLAICLAATLMRNAASLPWSLIPLFGCFFADMLPTHLPFSKKKRRTKRPNRFLTAIAALLAAIMGVALSTL